MRKFYMGGSAGMASVENRNFWIFEMKKFNF